MGSEINELPGSPSGYHRVKKQEREFSKTQSKNIPYIPGVKMEIVKGAKG